MKTIYRGIFWVACISTIGACKRQDDWLDIKRNKSDITPKNLSDFQALLENSDVVNQTPSLGFLSSDNYFISADLWQALSTNTERNAYNWSKDIFSNDPPIDWNSSYTCIAYSNIVLEGLQKISRTQTNAVEYDNIKGSAYFFRGFALYNLAQIFAKPYDKLTAKKDLGIPIRLTSDVNVKTVRSTLDQTFEQIINDVSQAENLLANLPLSKNRPSKLATFVLFAKVYMQLGDYAKVIYYCDKVLEQNSSLIDFNTLSLIPYSFPFPEFRDNNPELIFYAYTGGYSLSNNLWYDPQASVDTNLYKSYLDNDLRKDFFYTTAFGGLNFQGSYTGNTYLFSGFAVNEIYLLRAEANARLKNISEALNDLNTLLRSRWKTNEFIDYSADSPEEALQLIIGERNKELPFTGTTRWEDLRRLNKEGIWNKTLTRKIGNETYLLPPNDNRYVLPVPPDEIRLSGIEQNPR